jgi:hypothetical protein
MPWEKMEKDFPFYAISLRFGLEIWRTPLAKVILGASQVNLRAAGTKHGIHSQNKLMSMA